MSERVDEQPERLELVRLTNNPEFQALLDEWAELQEKRAAGVMNGPDFEKKGPDLDEHAAGETRKTRGYVDDLDEVENGILERTKIIMDRSYPKEQRKVQNADVVADPDWYRQILNTQLKLRGQRE